MRDEQAGYPTRGLDIHGGLRIRLEYDKASRTILARESAEPGTNVRKDVEHYIAHLQQQAGLARAWLIQWRRQQGEPMEEVAPASPPKTSGHNALADQDHLARVVEAADALRECLAAYQPFKGSHGAAVLAAYDAALAEARAEKEDRA